MNIPRMLGAGIVMIIPSFVAIGFVWSLFHNWPVTFLGAAIMAFVTGMVMRKIASLESDH